MDDRPYGLLLICYQLLETPKRLFLFNYFVIIKSFFIKVLSIKKLRQNAPEHTLISI